MLNGSQLHITRATRSQSLIYSGRNIIGAYDWLMSVSRDVTGMYIFTSGERMFARHALLK